VNGLTGRLIRVARRSLRLESLREYPPRRLRLERALPTRSQSLLIEYSPRVLVHPLGAPVGSRHKARIVSWLTPKASAKTRKLRWSATLRIVAFCDAVNLPCLGDWYEARLDFPPTRRGGTTAISIGSVPMES
jgi:hypothetical protein